MLNDSVLHKHCVSKNDTDVAHYNFNAYQPILVIFGRDVNAETDAIKWWFVTSLCNCLFVCLAFILFSFTYLLCNSPACHNVISLFFSLHVSCLQVYVSLLCCKNTPADFSPCPCFYWTQTAPALYEDRSRCLTPYMTLFGVVTCEMKSFQKIFQPSSTSVWNSFAWNYFRILSDACCSSRTFSNMFNVAEIILK